MKSLLNKELRLAASPLSFYFLAFSLMTFLPGYPILLGSFFVCLGLFQSFQNSRENNDILYTVLLPVEKEDAVRSKYLFVVLIELTAWLLMAVFTVIRMTALRDAAVYLQNPMMNANPVYLAWSALVFTLFNVLFLGGFFRTGYKFGGPFLRFAAGATVLVILGEVLHHIPGLTFLNGNGRLGLQLCLLAAALIAAAGATALSLRRARTVFASIDL